MASLNFQLGKEKPQNHLYTVESFPSILSTLGPEKYPIMSALAMHFEIAVCNLAQASLSFLDSCNVDPCSHSP